MPYPLTWPAYTLYEASHVVGPCLLYRAPYVANGADPLPAAMLPIGDLADSIGWQHTVAYGKADLLQLYNSLRAHLQKEDFKITGTLHHAKMNVLSFMLGRPQGRLITVAPSFVVGGANVTSGPAANQLTRASGVWEASVVPGVGLQLVGMPSLNVTVLAVNSTTVITVSADTTAFGMPTVYRIGVQGTNTMGFGEPTDILNPATNRPSVEPQYACWFLLFPSPEFNFATNPTAEWGAMRLFKAAVVTHGEPKFARKDEFSMQFTIEAFTDLTAAGPDHVAKMYTFTPEF